VLEELGRFGSDSGVTRPDPGSVTGAEGAISPASGAGPFLTTRGGPASAFGWAKRGASGSGTQAIPGRKKRSLGTTPLMLIIIIIYSIYMYICIYILIIIYNIIYNII